MKNNFAALVLAALACPAFAQQGVDVAPMRPSELPAPAAATSAALQASMPVVIGAPPALSVQGAPTPSASDKAAAAAAPLRYFDGSKRLTIGEMSDMQRKRLAEEFLAKHGYTTTEPAKPPPQVRVKAPPPPPPPHTVTVRAVYGPTAKQQVDLSLDGRLVSLSLGSRTTLGAATIIARPGTGDSVLIEVPPRNVAGCKAAKPSTGKGKPKTCKQTKAITAPLKVGEVLEIAR